MACFVFHKFKPLDDYSQQKCSGKNESRDESYFVLISFMRLYIYFFSFPFGKQEREVRAHITTKINARSQRK